LKGQQMDYKFLFVCCVFSFITGMYIAVVYPKDTGCVVKMSRGQETHVLIGTR